MLNDFIRDTINLIEKSNFELQFPEIFDTILEEDNNKKISMEFIDYTGITVNVKNNFLLISSILFLLVDTYLDTIYSNIEGQSFKQRYENIDDSDDIDIIFKEIYRILKLIRNATIHSKSAITINNNVYTINYNFRTTNFNLSISKQSFENLISLVIFIINGKNNNTINEYIVSILRTYYRDIKANIIINDEFSNQLLDINNTLYLKNMRRYRVLNPRYTIENNLLSIIPFEIHEVEKSFSGVDYVIDYENIKYLLPEETLNDNTISTQDIDKWKYFDLKTITRPWSQ